MEFQDYYAVLGVPRDATEKQIRAAYRKLARQHHPDVNPGNTEAEERFKQINEAYEVLSDPEKRKRYDEVGSRWQEYEQRQRTGQAAGQAGAPFDWGAFGGDAPGATYSYRTVDNDDLRDMFGDESPFSDFFESLFGGSGPGSAAAGGQRRRPRTRRRTGNDLEQPVEVSLADAYRGTTVQLSIRTADGSTRRIEVKIPPGVRNGSRVRVSGQGGQGEGGGPAGDLYLVVTVQPDPRFERRGDDLHTDVRAPLQVLLLGGEARVPTPDGRTLALTVPPDTQDGRLFRLRGQGMPRLGSPSVRGDLHAALHADLPQRLSKRQRELVQEFANAGAERADGAVRR